MAEKIAVLGIYPNYSSVENGVDVLKEAGFRNTDISVLFPEKVVSKNFAHKKGTKAPKGALAGAGTGALATGQTLVYLHDWTFTLGQSFFPAVNALLIGSLLYQSRLVPRILPVIGFIGAPLLVASTMATLFGANQ